MAHPGLEGVAELGLGLVVAVEVDARRIEPGGQRYVKLAARSDVDGEALLPHHPVGRSGGERLAGVDHLERIGAPLEGANVCPGPAAHVLLRIDVGRGPELLRELDDVAARNLQVAVLVHSRPRWVDRRAGDRVGGRHRPGGVRG
jgi:hypothetical protein